MKPVFDESGLALTSGNLRCFYYDALTSEYMGWSEEYINVGVSMPGHSTDINPGDDVVGEVSVFTGNGWQKNKDLRGQTVYSTESVEASTIDYIGPVKSGYTSKVPSTPYDEWNGNTWVTDADAMHVAIVTAADLHKKSLLEAARMITSDWKAELELGIISDKDKMSLIAWLDYIKELKAVDTSKAPDINWPVQPAV